MHNERHLVSNCCFIKLNVDLGDGDPGGFDVGTGVVAREESEIL